MQQSVPLHLRRSATCMVDVVALEGDHIARTIEIDAPIVVAVTGGRVVRLTVDEGVGDGDAVVGLCTQNNVLTADTCGLFISVRLYFFSR